MRKALVPVTVLLALLIAPGALAARHRAHRVHHVCKQGYVERSRRVRRHRGHKTAYVRVTTCVKRPVKHKAASTTQPPALAPAPVVKLHAHLDPTFTRDPSDPFKVTYAYSASATATMSAALATTTEPAPLPEGVLNLYNDGLLACSINVGGETTGGQCPIEYKTLGEHKVTTVYASGATSATETSVENIEPFKGGVALSVTYAPFEHSTSMGSAGEECGWVGSYPNAKYECRAPYRKYLIGELSISGAASTAYGEAPGHVNVSGADSLAGTAPRSLPVCALASETEPTVPINVIFGECPTAQEEGSTGVSKSGNPWASAPSASTIEAGSIVLEGTDTEAGSGFDLAADRKPVQFTPAIRS